MTEKESIIFSGKLMKIKVLFLLKLFLQFSTNYSPGKKITLRKIFFDYRFHRSAFGASSCFFFFLVFFFRSAFGAGSSPVTATAVAAAYAAARALVGSEPACRERSQVPPVIPSAHGQAE